MRRHRWHPAQPPKLTCPQTERTIVRPADWTTVPVPAAIAALPRDPATGYPAFFTVQQPDGSVNFKGMNMERWLIAGRDRLCGICGQPLGYWICFAGGPKSASTRIFTDPPMHQECLDYAWLVCPYLIHNGYVRPEPQPGTFIPDPYGDRGRPAKLGVYLTREYTRLAVDGAYYFKASAPKSIEWRTVVKEDRQ